MCRSSRQSTIAFSGGIARISVRGRVSSGDIQDIILSLVSHARYVPRMDSMWDFSEADLAAFDTRELLALADFMATRTERHDVRVAYVAPQALEFGILRMWLAYARTAVPQDRRLFRSFDAARNWLETGSERPAAG